MIHVKVCGITRPDDARAAFDEGADFLGLVFAPSPRQVGLETARRIMRSLPEFNNWVAVFVDAPLLEIRNTAGELGIRYLQLHGRETAEDCRYLQSSGYNIIKAFKIKDDSSFDMTADYPAPYYLLDSFSKVQGGSGISFDWKLLQGRRFPAKIFLSGGLRAERLPEALKSFLPYAVDVSSGVESSPGIKDRRMIRNFLRTVKELAHG